MSDTPSESEDVRRDKASSGNVKPNEKISTSHVATSNTSKNGPEETGLTEQGQDSSGSSQSSSSSSSSSADDPTSVAARKRRRGSRGGRGRSTAARRARAAERDAASESTDANAAQGASVQASNVTSEKPEARNTGASNTSDSESSAGETDSEVAAVARRRRRRGGRRRTGARRPQEAALMATTDDEQDDTADVDNEVANANDSSREARRGRERKGRPVGRYLMCVQVREGATQIAVIEGRNLIEHYVSRPHDDVSQIDGNIYLSKVQNVLPGMEAAFIDIGTPKNAVLYRGDVRYDAEDLADGANKQEHPRIEQMIKSGQTLVCQVTKNPIGSKGARLTQEVSLPGRFVVLMPNSTTYGISKRLPDDERRRLRRILDEVKPKQHGIIMRTAAEGVTADELRRDVQRLLRQWEEIEKLANSSKAPMLLYREPDIAVRIIREEFNRNYRGVVIDNASLYEEVHDYVASISPELADRIEYYNPEEERLPLFEKYHVHEQLHKALDRKVWLPSGGSLIIERTEALTVIDVNTGKNVGKTNLEETVFRNNLEAATEISHQLRLRDIGGIIVIDFIDMEIKKNRDEVLARLREALASDKTRTQAYPIGELGLVEMTRKRVSEGLVESFSEMCPECNGRGFIIDNNLLTD